MVRSSSIFEMCRDIGSARIVHSPFELIFPRLFFEAGGFLPAGRRLIVKLEGFHITGSIKIKSALFMVDDLERRGLLSPGHSTMIESSSGNLGIALALVSLVRGYQFICVSDPNISPSHAQAIRAYGGELRIVCERDSSGGYLASRIDYIRRLVTEQPDVVWLNQYANTANQRAHAQWTANEILTVAPEVTHIYIGCGSTGTAMGVAEGMRLAAPQVEVVAVEPEGSVIFGTSPARRLISGIGASRRPELADASAVSRTCVVAESDAIAACQHFAARYGMLFGGSTGCVLAAAAADSGRIPANAVVVAVSPDMGDRYLDTIYDPVWVRENFGAGDEEERTSRRF